MEEDNEQLDWDVDDEEQSQNSHPPTTTLASLDANEAQGGADDDDAVSLGADDDENAYYAVEHLSNNLSPPVQADNDVEDDFARDNDDERPVSTPMPSNGHRRGGRRDRNTRRRRGSSASSPQRSSQLTPAKLIHGLPAKPITVEDAFSVRPTHPTRIAVAPMSQQQRPNRESSKKSAPKLPLQPIDDLPLGWETRQARSNGGTYFYNNLTHETQWDRPTSSSAINEPIHLAPSGPNNMSYNERHYRPGAEEEPSATVLLSHGKRPKIAMADSWVAEADNSRPRSLSPRGRSRRGRAGGRQRPTNNDRDMPLNGSRDDRRWEPNPSHPSSRSHQEVSDRDRGDITRDPPRPRRVEDTEPIEHEPTRSQSSSVPRQRTLSPTDRDPPVARQRRGPTRFGPAPVEDDPFVPTEFVASVPNSPGGEAHASINIQQFVQPVKITRGPQPLSPIAVQDSADQHRRQRVPLPPQSMSFLQESRGSNGGRGGFDSHPEENISGSAPPRGPRHVGADGPSNDESSGRNSRSNEGNNRRPLSPYHFQPSVGGGGALDRRVSPSDRRSFAGPNSSRHAAPPLEVTPTMPRAMTATGPAAPSMYPPRYKDTLSPGHSTQPLDTISRRDEPNPVRSPAERIQGRPQNSRSTTGPLPKMSGTNNIPLGTRKGVSGPQMANLPIEPSHDASIRAISDRAVSLSYRQHSDTEKKQVIPSPQDSFPNNSEFYMKHNLPLPPRKLAPPSDPSGFPSTGGRFDLPLRGHSIEEPVSASQYPRGAGELPKAAYLESKAAGRDMKDDERPHGLPEKPVESRSSRPPHYQDTDMQPISPAMHPTLPPRPISPPRGGVEQEGDKERSLLSRISDGRRDDHYSREERVASRVQGKRGHGAMVDGERLSETFDDSDRRFDDDDYGDSTKKRRRSNNSNRFRRGGRRGVPA